MPRTNDASVPTDGYSSSDFLRPAALAAAKWVGKGMRDEADQASCDAMRRAMDSMPIDATIV